MFVDASALAAIMAGEGDALELIARMQQASERITSPVAVWETAVAIGRLLGLSQKQANEAVFEYLELADIELVSAPPRTAALALDAFDRFGKGRHPAALNMGDCFAYACARHYNQPLMFKGNDFPRTDIETA